MNPPSPASKPSVDVRTLSLTQLQKLADRGSRLLFRHFLRPLLKPQLGQPDADGARSDEHHVYIAAAKIRQDTDKALYPLQVRPALFIGDGGRAYLDDHASGVDDV